MRYLINCLYALALAALLPWLFLRSVLTGRYRSGVRAKLLGRHGPLELDPARPTAWFHGVSVGEVHLLGVLVQAFRQRHPGWQCVVSATTDTGLSEARKRFPALPVIAFPFDFTWAVGRTMQQVQPRLIVLAESELWPNFLAAAQARRVPVVVANGRMSPRSLKRWAWLGRLAPSVLFRKVSRFAMQTEGYAEAMRKLGVDADRVVVTGSVKYDGARGDRDHASTRRLREELGLRPHEQVLVAGSTHAPEEQLILGVFRRLRVRLPHLRLILVPRSPDRFNEVAQLIQKQSFSLARRSEGPVPAGESPAVILLDTLGELGAAWGLADVGFVGGSFDGKRGGQSMIEPAAYGVPTVFGPFVWNFRDAARGLAECGAAQMVRTPQAAEQHLLHWLEDAPARQSAGDAARALVKAQQGATQRTLDCLDAFITQAATPARRAA